MKFITPHTVKQIQEGRWSTDNKTYLSLTLLLNCKPLTVQFQTPAANTDLAFGGISFASFKQETTPQKRTVFLEHHKLIFVIQGYKRMHFNNTTITVKPGSLLLLKRGLYVMSEIMPEGLDYQALAMLCSDAFLKEFYYNHVPKHDAAKEDPLLYLSIPSTRLLESFSQQFLSYFNTPDLPELDKILNLKLQELFLILISGSHRDDVMQWIGDVATRESMELDYVVKTYLFQPFTLEELAKLTNRSLASFKREFQLRYHESPKKWMNTQRLNHAKTLLQNSSRTISEIAVDCGYENIPYFSRAFKQEFGVSPQLCRKVQ